MNDLERYAEFNFKLRQEKKMADDVPTDLPKLDIDTAYQVQDLLVEKLCKARNTEVFGYKIGCTSEGAQKLLSTDGPVFAQMLRSGKYYSPLTVNADDYMMIVIEPEFAFELKDDVPAGEYDANSILEYVDAVIPSIEVVHHHLGGWDRFDAPKTIADNAIHAFWVSGLATADLAGLDFPSHEVTLYANDVEVASGRGEIALGNPLNVLAWLANTLPKYGKQLKADEIITTGVCMPVYTAKVGERIRADFGELGIVELNL
ncbi:MAG: hypothetical protein AAGD96_01970 [Chloroflexota bacterium]